MDATIVETLFVVLAAICAAFLLYGGWLCLGYGRGAKPALGNKEAITTTLRTAAGSPVHADERSGGGILLAEDGGVSRAGGRAIEVFDP